jgi:hypothetical protein
MTSPPCDREVNSALIALSTNQIPALGPLLSPTLLASTASATYSAKLKLLSLLVQWRFQRQDLLELLHLRRLEKVSFRLWLCPCVLFHVLTLS